MNDLNPNVAPPAPASSALPGSVGVAPPPPRRVGLGEWLWRSNALREVGASVPPAGQAAIRRGRGLLEVAQRAHVPVDPWRYGLGDAAAVSLLRSSILWFLRAGGGSAEPGAPAPSEAFSSAPRAWLDGLAGGEEGQFAVRQLLLRDPFEDAAQAAPVAHDEAALLLRAAESLLAKVDERDQQTASLLRERGTRVVSLVLVVGLAIGGIVYGTRTLRRGPDLAKGKPIVTSSVYSGFNAGTHMVDANPSEVLFHTSEEVNPWAEIDLGAPTKVGSVEVKNRGDCCADRALPFTVEISLDQKNWTEVARKNEPFTTLRLSVGQQTARWVRFSVKKRTWFHLDAVHIYGR